MGTNSDAGSRTLEQLEGHRWGNAPADATRLMRTVHELRHKPIGSMTAEDLRILLGQQVGVEALTPVALTHLEQNPLTEGDFYPGDLLSAVLRIPQEHWRRHPDQGQRVSGVLKAVEHLGNLNDHGAPHDSIWEEITRFRG